MLTQEKYNERVAKKKRHAKKYVYTMQREIHLASKQKERRLQWLAEQKNQ